MQAVIMAGGKGTRLASLTHDQIPKPMLPVAGKPILQWQVEKLRENGVSQLVLLIGHLGQSIRDYFGDGHRFGVSIRYYQETEPLGTAGALRYLPPLLTAEGENPVSGDGRDEPFLLVFGDLIFDIDVQRLLDFHQRKQALLTLFAHPNSHPQDSDLIVADADDRVSAIDSKHNIRDYWYENLVNAGIYCCQPDVCQLIPATGKADLEKDVIIPLLTADTVEVKGAQGPSWEAPNHSLSPNSGPVCRVFAYRSTEYVKDAGTPERIAEVEQALQGFAAARNLSRPQKAVFLDRDGTLNVYCGLLYQEEQLELLPGVAAALHRLNASQWLALVVTNQPVVARGLTDEAGVQLINRKLQTLLGRQGAFLDDLLYCPHHPDRGYPEERPEYKIPCDCRKPATGMIETLAQRFNIDLSQSWLVGDSSVDMQTAANAGLRSILVQTGEAGQDARYPAQPNYTVSDLSAAVDLILSE